MEQSIFSRNQKEQDGARTQIVPRQSRPDGPHDFPTFPPPPPINILSNRAEYLIKLRSRRYMAPEGIMEDSSLFALYRLYEYFVVDYTIGYRNQIEYFWHKHTWAVSEIPDPKDNDPARYAFLACIPHLLVAAFNRNIKLGLPQDAPAIISPEQAEDYKARPESEKFYEEVPEWTKYVPALTETLVMFSHDGIALDGPDDDRAEEHFQSDEHTILVSTYFLHIKFTKFSKYQARPVNHCILDCALIQYTSTCSYLRSIKLLCDTSSLIPSLVFFLYLTKHVDIHLKAVTLLPRMDSS